MKSFEIITLDDDECEEQKVDKSKLSIPLEQSVNLQELKPNVQEDFRKLIFHMQQNQKLKKNTQVQRPLQQQKLAQQTQQQKQIAQVVNQPANITNQSINEIEIDSTKQVEDILQRRKEFNTKVNQQYQEKIQENPLFKDELATFSMEIIKTIRDLTNNPNYSISMDDFLILMYSFSWDLPRAKLFFFSQPIAYMVFLNNLE